MKRSPAKPKKSNYAKHKAALKPKKTVVAKEPVTSTARKLLPGCVDALKMMALLANELQQRLGHRSFTVSIEMMSDHWALAVRGIDPKSSDAMLDYFNGYPVHYIESSVYRSI